MNKNNLKQNRIGIFTVEYSDALVNGFIITLPPIIVGSYNVSSVDEFKDHFDPSLLIEIKVINLKIKTTDEVKLFLSKNGNIYEIHRIFEIYELEQQRYITSFLVKK